MIKYLKETEEFVKITGFKNIKIENIKEFVRKIRQEIPPKTWIQFFDASVVATRQHPFFALLNAKLAFRNHKNISKSIQMETLLFSSGQHQINKAIKKIGINVNSQEIVVMIVASKIAQVNYILSLISRLINKEPDETVLEISYQKQKKIHSIFEISKKEIESIMKKENIENATRNIILKRASTIHLALLGFSMRSHH